VKIIFKNHSVEYNKFDLIYVEDDILCFRVDFSGGNQYELKYSYPMNAEIVFNNINTAYYEGETVCNIDYGLECAINLYNDYNSITHRIYNGTII
jgi:hypothetical protein